MPQGIFHDLCLWAMDDALGHKTIRITRWDFRECPCLLVLTCLKVLVIDKNVLISLSISRRVECKAHQDVATRFRFDMPGPSTLQS